MSRLSKLRAKKAEIESGSSTADLVKHFQKEIEGGSKKQDDRFWKLTVDNAGNGQAIIRFLPGHEKDNDAPFIKFWDHGFKGPKGWYIEKSLTTLGKGIEDPVTQLNSAMWNAQHPFDDPVEWPQERREKTARSRKRRPHYVSNILVVKDPANSDNDGKVFLFEYGPMLFKAITDVMPMGNGGSDDLVDSPKFNPFDLDEGANFLLKAYNKDGGNYRSYDKSRFLEQKPVASTDAEMEEVLDDLYHLGDLITPDKFKTYAELSMRLAQVLGDESIIPTSTTQDPMQAPGAASNVLSDDTLTDIVTGSSSENDTSSESSEDLEDDVMAMFEKMVNDAE